MWSRPGPDRLPYSLLYHQTMSTLASCGEMTPGELACRVLPLSCFHRVTQEDYRDPAPPSAGNRPHQPDGKRRPDGGPYRGTDRKQLQILRRVPGEHRVLRPLRLRRSWAPSSSRRPWGIRSPSPGRVWVVEEVDHKKREVYCTLVKGNIPAYFGDVAGDIHTRILERMYTRPAGGQKPTPT